MRSPVTENADEQVEKSFATAVGISPNWQLGQSTMNSDVQIRTIGPPQRELLIAMYDRFEPLGAALGLPPRTSEARQQWVGNALAQMVTVAAFSPAGEVVGHCFLAADKPSSAEIAVFVRQEFRRRGVGAELVKKALKWASAKGLASVWAVTPSDNRAALQLLMKSGFRLLKSTFGTVRLDIDCAR